MRAHEAKKGLVGGNARDAHYPQVFAATVKVAGHSKRSLVMMTQWHGLNRGA